MKCMMISTSYYWILSVLLELTTAWQSAISQEGVTLRLGEVTYANQSTISISSIGENNQALICQTDKRPCCRGQNRAGEWYYPNGSRILIEDSGSNLYRNRGYDGEVRLNRRNNALDPIGIYHCEVPDAGNINRTVYVGLLRYGDYGNSILDLTYDINSSKLTCVTSGGSANSLYGQCINEPKCPNSWYHHLKVTVNPERSTYNNSITVVNKNNSNFVCTTIHETGVNFATLLTKFGRDNRALLSQLVGRVGEQVTLLCMGEAQVQSAAWTGQGTSQNNITFTHLQSANAGVYTCRGRTVDNKVVSHSVNLKVSNCSATVWIARTSPTAIIGRDCTLRCDSIKWGTGCTVSAYYIYHENHLISRNNTVMFQPLRLSNTGFYICIVTIGGFNFTSNPTFFPLFAQFPSPVLDISSSHGNPVTLGSHPTLTCTITIDASVDRDHHVSVLWNGPVYGFGEFRMTAPLLNSSAEVPTYTNTATLDADGTFYDSGGYNCSATVSSLSIADLIQNSSATSESISVKFLYPQRPNLHMINSRGHNWIYLTWNQNPASENISNYEVKYSYIGECSGVARAIMSRWGLNSSTTSFNITGLAGEYFNYSINLTAINNNGSSPPNIAYAVTSSAAPSGGPQQFTQTLELSTNITLRWGRVSCVDRNSKITHYFLRYARLVNGNNTDQRELRVQGVSEEDRVYTVNGLHPQSMYNVTIAAMNMNGDEGPSSMITVTTTTPESVPFQIQLIGVHSCLQWRITNPEGKVYDVSEGIVEGINRHCSHCQMKNDDFTDREFQCFPGSPNQVTFRGKVQDRAQEIAREVIHYMELWITSSDSVSIPVHHARLIINSTCVVLIDSLDDPECPDYLRAGESMDTTTTVTVASTSGGTDLVTTSPQPDQMSTTRSDHTNTPSITVQSSGGVTVDTGAIVGGAVAIVLIVTSGVVIVVLLYMILKFHHKTDNKSCYTLSTVGMPQETKVDSKIATVERRKQEEDEVQNYTYIEVTRASHKTHLENKQSRLQPQSKDADKSNTENVKEENVESYYEI